MKFSIGDKVILKQTGEEGVVSDFIGKDMLEVAVNGTHFPVYTDEVDHPYLKWFTEQKKKKKPSLPETLPAEKQKDRVLRLPKGIYLAFLPVFNIQELEDVAEQLKVYLVNETPVDIYFSYDFRVSGQSMFQLKGSLHSFGHLHLHTIDFACMNDQPRFHWQLENALNRNTGMEEGVLRIKPARIFAHLNELLEKNEPMFSYRLINDFRLSDKILPKKVAEKVQALPHPVRKTKKISSFADIPRHELDLHIEQLITDHKGMTNAEIMHIQLETLRRFLEIAIVTGQERLVIIHGLGTGALRKAVHDILKNTSEIAHYRNEYMAKYGFGATEVIFRRN